MMTALYSGSTGIKTHGEGLHVVSNNIANVNTVAFKQQSALFHDLFSENLAMGNAYGITTNQLGMGSQLGDVRTLFTQGAFETSNSMTDLAIAGKGYFQVTDGEEALYTRAGNFNFTNDYVLREPTGMALSGNIVNEDGTISTELVPIQITEAMLTTPPKATETVSAEINIGENNDMSENQTNPYFSMLSNWSGNAEAPAENLSKDLYNYSQALKLYDSDGTLHEVTLYLDGAPSQSGQQTMEFIIAADPSQLLAEGETPSTGTGLLMSGTLTFSSSGEIVDMSAFVPSDGDPADLTSWTTAPLNNGQPQFTVSFPGVEPQVVTLDLGFASTNSAWTGDVASAADVGTDQANLPSMGPITLQSDSITAFSGSSYTRISSQDGYGLGDFINFEITEDGFVRGVYTNNQNVDLYNIPVFRFTSEDGLHREGNNMYSATPDAGLMEYGQAGTSNYGEVYAQHLEVSNVDMAREMTNLIMMQRGYQLNSKTITTADTMLQKAMEIKR